MEEQPRGRGDGRQKRKNLEGTARVWAADTSLPLWASHSPGGLSSPLLSEELGGLFLRSFPGINFWDANV